MAGKKEECQFCENFILGNLKFSCEDCNLTLCEICNEKIHTKLPSLVEHKVTEIKIQACSNEESINLDKVLCFKHNENKCFAVCPNCCNCLCNLCLVKQNNQEKLHEIYEQKLKDMKDYSNKTEEDISYFSENLNKLKETKARGLEMYNEIKKQILDKEEEMKDKVAEKAMALVKELDDWWLPQQDEITKEEERMDKAECDLRQRKTIIEDAVMSEKSESVISAADRVMKDFPIKSAKKIEIQNLLKFSTKISSKNLEVGLLLKIPKLEIVKSFESNQYEHLAKLNEDVYMGYMSPNIEHFILTDKKCYKTNSFLIGYMCDITLNTSGTLLFTTNSQIQTLDTKGNTTNFQSDIKFNARGIHSKASIHGKYIIVGVVDNKKSLFPVPNDSHRRILFLSMKGDIIKTIENDTNGKKLFCLPNVITTNINGDICVIDTMNKNKWEGRVITLESGGMLRWMYEGHPAINVEHKFSPRSLTTTSTGDIFIADHNSNSIHMLSMDGEFITSIGEKEGILRPMSVATDKKGLIITCCQNPRTDRSAGTTGSIGVFGYSGRHGLLHILQVLY